MSLSPMATLAPGSISISASEITCRKRSRSLDGHQWEISSEDLDDNDNDDAALFGSNALPGLISQITLLKKHAKSATVDKMTNDIVNKCEYCGLFRSTWIEKDDNNQFL
jgi:hypothetical protein